MAAAPSEYAELDARLEALRGRKRSPAEVREQRVSLIMGLRASNSTLTHKRVREVLTEHGM
jgi:hypothetical protein